MRRPSSAIGRIAAHASANQITPRTACTAPTNVTASTSSSKRGEPAAGNVGPRARPAQEREHPEQRGRPARARPLPLAQDLRERRVDEHQVVVGDDVPAVRRREDAERCEHEERSRKERRGPAVSHEHRERRGAPSGRRRERPSRGGSPTGRGAGGRAASSAGRRSGSRRRAARARPAKSGSAADWARIVQPHGPASTASRPTRNVDRDDAPLERAAAAASASASRTSRTSRTTTARIPRELVGAVEDELREPLLVGPGRALAEDRDLLGARQPVLDDLAAGHERQPRVADDERRREHRQQDDADERDERDRERVPLEKRADARARPPSRIPRARRRTRPHDRRRGGGPDWTMG